MEAFATVADVQDRMLRTMSDEEERICEKLLKDAAIIIDSMAENASLYAKNMVSCRMVIRALGDGGESGVPIGATQGSQSALGYSQSWTISSGSCGELYLSKIEKKLLKVGNKIGSYSPVETIACRRGPES